jgi:hypothetical protein
MDKVRNPSNSVCYTPSSEPYRIYFFNPSKKNYFGCAANRKIVNILNIIGKNVLFLLYLATATFVFVAAS